jgi:DUF1365 family protein
MSHQLYEGRIFHKRFTPQEHQFIYPFFLLDIDVAQLASLKGKLFGYDRFNLFSFSTKDHFGKSKDFYQNIVALLEQYGVEATQKMRFLTLPRMVNFVFNPISILILFDECSRPTQMFVEVHNYNGGRIVYPVVLEALSLTRYRGEVAKDMYVSPFLKRDGVYHFGLRVEEGRLLIGITLYEEGKKKLIASFDGEARPFHSRSLLKLFARHTFLTLWVVTRTLWQSLRLMRKGIKSHPVTHQDQIRRV